MVAKKYFKVSGAMSDLFVIRFKMFPIVELTILSQHFFDQGLISGNFTALKLKVPKISFGTAS